MWITDLDITFVHEGTKYMFNVKDMKRDMTDGGGRPIFASVCHDENGYICYVNLTSDWRVKSLFRTENRMHN